MTALPFPAGAFDCVYATESLEHAVEIDVAVAEMCRVVRPGGRIVDYRQERAAVGTAENSASGRNGSAERNWRNCSRGIARGFPAAPISYWEDVAPDGLFLAWLAGAVGLTS